MKSIILFSCLFISSLAFSQMDYNKWSAGLSIGSHDGLFPTKTTTKVYQIHHFGANGRYMLNNKLGVMLDVGYDYMDFYSNPVNTHYWRTSIQGVVNVGNLMCFDTWTNRIGMLVHGGAGMSHMWLKKELRNENADDKLFVGIDDMINYTFGATPQFRITDKISLNADLSFTFHTRQSNTWTMDRPNKRGPIDGYLINTTIGASYYFGKNEKHADWAASNCNATASTDNSKYDAYEARIRELEMQLADDDNDGIPNARDLEPGTAEDAIVDSKGRTLLDTDGDKIPDVADLCPNEAGLYSDNGCPDSDNDGVDDLKDKCPDVPGVHENDGCPAIEAAVQRVLTKALKGVQFETGKDVLLTRSFKVLNAVVVVMEEHPEYYLEINGHTDDVGEEDANLDLSKRRAQSVTNYLVKNGVEKERLHPEGYGETQPKVSNETPAGQAQNRRVEFKVVYE